MEVKMNKVIIVGNVCNDIELKKTQSGKSVCEFTIAVNESYNGENKAEYIDIQAWEKNAENLSKYVTKGNKLLVEGKIRSNTYENKKGDKVKRTVVLANNFEFLTSKNNGDGAHNKSAQQNLDAQLDFQDTNNVRTNGQTVGTEVDELPFY